MLAPEVAVERRWFSYNFVVRVPLTLNETTARVEEFIKARKRAAFLSYVIARIDGRVFEIKYYRIPIPPIEGVIIPSSDGGGSDIVVNISTLEWLMALPIIFILMTLAVTAPELWPGATGPALAIVLLFASSRLRGPHFQKQLVEFFTQP